MKQWVIMGVLKRNAMRAITAFPRMTPIVTLQELANKNTHRELIESKEQVRGKKRKLIEIVARVHGENMSQHLRYIPLPPWEYQTRN